MGVEVAQEILYQLGGMEFVAATGVKDLYAAGDGILVMTLPENQSGANRLEIKLDYGTDTYIMRFYKCSPPKLKVNHKAQTAVMSYGKEEEVRKFTDVYFDMLQELFTEVTGFNTRLPRIIGINC